MDSVYTNLLRLSCQNWHFLHNICGLEFRKLAASFIKQSYFGKTKKTYTHTAKLCNFGIIMIVLVEGTMHVCRVSEYVSIIIIEMSIWNANQFYFISLSLTTKFA